MCRMRRFIALLLCSVALPAVGQSPISAAPDLLDFNQPATLGLNLAPGTETARVFTAGDNRYQYSRGAVPVAFNGKLFVQWQAAPDAEQTVRSQVHYAMSVDGRQWSDAIVLAKSSPGVNVSAGGWWVFGDTLVAYINIWPQSETPENGTVEYRTSRDGIRWTAAQPVLDSSGEPLAGAIEPGIGALRDGRLLTALHQPPGLVAKPYFTDDATGRTGWQAGEMLNAPSRDNLSRELEPSWFSRGNEQVMVFRDRDSSYRILAAVSDDRGETWSLPTLSNIPDSRAKANAGNLTADSAYIVNNPSGNRARFPLVVFTSADGYTFDRAWLLRRGAHSIPAPNDLRRKLYPAYSAPKTEVFEGYLYVTYTTENANIDITRVPLNAIESGAE
ncbi:exo-alpha-sialidase [Gilvimarinus sp. 1_MG-2023]|uniref:exo-alpha-sialidase n=1 Tax=Gilvimarinus sp. 1_MG-2023 TaxID=3062638 RepID=UPI0026E1B904|nr:exo-alpha-sialidase [Gilvimarinus sp. 1_MG-2023]MDO6747785.1 exo-alpha-sialidase [Gilvimarinus sp. 1_MG-2023]